MLNSCGLKLMLQMPFFEAHVSTLFLVCWGQSLFEHFPKYILNGVLFSFPCWSLPDKLPTTPMGIPMASGILMATGQEKKISRKVASYSYGYSHG